MKLRVVIAIAVSCGWAPGAQADRQPDPAQAQPPQAGADEVVPEPTLADWIGRLGDDSYDVREQASAALWSAGEEAIEELKQALLSDDPEVVARARAVVDKIDFGILPDTPPEVLALVAGYANVDERNKSTVLIQLRRLNAWRPMLKLYQREADPAVRKELRQVIENVAVLAAREQVVAGRLERALEYLEMAPADASGMAGWASFHAACGTARGELRRFADMEGREGSLHRMALKRALGDIDGAISEAEAAGEKKIVAALEILRGNPVAWLELPPRDRFRTYFHESYRRWAIDHWRTGAGDPAIVEGMIQAFDKSDHDDQLSGLNALMLAGAHDAAAERIGVTSSVSGFQHYDSIERVDDALRVFGIDPGKPDFRGWAGRKIERILAKPEESENEEGELIRLCSFLEARGMVDEAEACLQPWLAGLAKGDEEVLIAVIGRLFVFLVIEPTIRVAAGWAGEDGDRWDKLAVEVLGQEPEDRRLWDWLGEKDQGLQGEQRWRVLMGMLGVTQVPDKVCQEWVDRLRAAAEKARGKDRDRLLDMTCDVAISAGDAGRALEALRELGKDKAQHPRFRDLLMVLAAAGHWGEVADMWRAQIETGPDRPSTQAYLAASLRRDGREKEAREIEELIEKLVMGDAPTCLGVAGAYSFAGDFKRAAEWQRRALVEGDPEADGFPAVVASLKRTALDDADWKLAAALCEVEAVLGMERERIYEEVPLLKLRTRFEADFARAMRMLDGNRESALGLIEKCHGLLPSDGMIADYFLPALRAAGLGAEHDRYFDAAWQRLGEVIKRFPGSHNTRNTAAWIAARGARRLDEAQVHLEAAFEQRPRQAAYLDTMAELWFARRNRDKAVEWSSRAVANDLGDIQLLRQFERFRSGEFPVR